MHVDPILPEVCALALVVLILGALLRKLRQPPVVAYIVAGVVMGPSGLALVKNVHIFERVGALGVLFLLFFAGMEIELRPLLSKWRVLIFGTLLQVILSVATVWALGAGLGWKPSRILLLGFVISLSSTAVVIGLLRDRGELDTAVGRLVAGILLVQDIAIVPMLISVNLMAGDQISLPTLGLQAVGAVAVGAILAWIARGNRIAIPFSKHIRVERELELFAAFLVCFGIALLTGLLGLSAALGAFIAGLVVAATDDSRWIREHLEAFRILTVSVFFVAVGAQVDLSFVLTHWHVVVGLVIAALATNTVINGAILRLAKAPWREAIYGGALLAQIGEFSFVLVGVGLTAGLIEQFTYQATLVVISITLLLSPAYVGAARALTTVQARNLGASAEHA